MGLSKSNPPTTQVKLLVRPSSGRIPWPLLSWLALGSGAVFLVLIILSGARLIVDPYSPNWLKTAFPGLINSFEAAPQTVAEIRSEMRSQGITAGKPLPWPTIDQPQAWFYPILDSKDNTIQELWVYRVHGHQLQRVEQIAIRPMKESFITTPLVGTASQVASVDSDAPLSSVKLMPSKLESGPWLLFEGQCRYGNTPMRYGQILSYQPNNQRIHRLLNWSSPAGQPPRWQTSTTGEQLMIEHTVGLRPSFLLYQLVPNNPPRLQEISLYRSVYDADLSTSLYDKALRLAQGGVWSHSLQMMLSAKDTLDQDWSPAAQAQLDLIRLHTERTQAQANQTWSSQQQHILAYLIHGQWDQALKVLENNPAIYESTLKRLERDFDALWRGVTTHLQVHPEDVTTQIWGALLVTSRQSATAGEEWLQKHSRSPKTLARFQALDGRLANEAGADSTELAADLSTETAALPTALNAGRYRSLIGQVRRIQTPGNGWLRSQTLPTLVPSQTWYQIDIQLLQDASGWGLPPTSSTAASFWADSLNLRRQLQLFQGNTAIAGLTIHGVKRIGTGITLLAAGPKVDGPLLATTAGSLQWVSTLPWQPAPMPTATSLPDEATNSDNSAAIAAPQTSTANPGPASLIAATVGQQLGLTSEQTTQIYPYLQYARLDITGDASPEHLISFGDGIPTELGITPGKIMIFSDAGALLYSDIGQQQSLLALTDKHSEQSTTLLVEQAGRYDVTRL